MKIKLGWVTVKDLTKAKKFFSVLGLTLKTTDTQHGWLEFAGNTEEFTLGVWQEGKQLTLPGKAGTNALLTFYVDNIVKKKQELENKDICFTSDIYKLPKGVLIADFTDEAGNQYQLVQDNS